VYITFDAHRYPGGDGIATRCADALGGRRTTLRAPAAAVANVVVMGASFGLGTAAATATAAAR
jgi:hypothetical protein